MSTPAVTPAMTEQFAKAANARAWELISKEERSPEENEEMLLAASASCYHWMQVGKPIHAHRGWWLVARAAMVAGLNSMARMATARCILLASKHAADLKDYDVAYTAECQSRLFAMNGDKRSALDSMVRAIELGKAIKETEDRAQFAADFRMGPWFGIKVGMAP